MRGDITATGALNDQHRVAGNPVVNITCPNCALRFPLAAGANDADARRFAAMLGELPPVVGRPLIDYLGLFKPRKSGLRWSRMLIAGEVRRDGRVLPASADIWADGLRQMADKRDRLTLPLKSNGYLRELVYGLADKAGAQAERRRELALRRGQRDEAGPAVKSRGQVKSEIRALENLLDGAPEAAKPALRKQIDGLREELDGAGA